MVPLSADLTRQPQRVHHLLFSLLHFFHRRAPLEAHLEVEANDLKYLLISRREAHVLLIPGQFRLALDNDLDLFVLSHDRVAHVLRILEAVLDVLWEGEARLDLACLVRNCIDHLAVLEHVLLLEELAVRRLFDPLDTFHIVLGQDEDDNALGDHEVLELSHGQHDDVHDVVILLHQVEYREQSLDLHLVDLVGVDRHGGHERGATLGPIHPSLPKLRKGCTHAYSRLLLVEHVDRVLIQPASLLLVGQVLQLLTGCRELGVRRRAWRFRLCCRP